MIRVLMVGLLSSVGGHQSFVINYYRHIDKSRFHVDFLGVYGHPSPYQEEIESSGGKVYYWNRTFGFPEFLSSLSALVRFLKDGHYDIIHSNLYLGDCWFVTAARIAGVKVRISHSHSTFKIADLSDVLLKRLYYTVVLKRQLLNNANLFFACGEKAGRSLFGRKKFIVIRNAIDIDGFYDISLSATEKIKQEFAVNENTKVYASISRFDRNKNLLFAVKLFEKIHNQIPDSILIAGGTEPYEESTREELEQYVRNSKLQNCVYIVGTRYDISDIMHIVDCWLLPSFHEGLPITGIELQASSVRILASDTITHEMDMGLGLVEYLPLNDMDAWYRSALLPRVRLSKETIKQAFAGKGYCVEESVKELEEYYSHAVVADSFGGHCFFA